ncbi:MAG: acyl-CoA dehydrogenase family protein [Actinomycetota bacterium]
MDFAFSEEQEMLRSQARAYLADRFPPERVAELADAEVPPGLGDLAWGEIAELGWIGLSVPESHGGAGMGFLDEAVLFEELGRALYPGPYFATVALAIPALHAGGADLTDVISGAAAATLAWAEPSGPNRLDARGALATTAEESAAGWTLTGDKVLVPDLTVAGRVAVVAAAPAGVGIWEAAGRGLDMRALVSTDTTRRLGTLTLAASSALPLVAPGAGERVVAAIRSRAHAALALEAVGVASKALEGAVSFARERNQFGKPIGSYQAVAHPIATTYMETELARSLAYWAAWCVAEDDAQAPVAAAAAKSFAAEAAVAACERSMQVHGGVGFTWEHPLHRYYKRARWIESFDGFGPAQRASVADALLG